MGERNVLREFLWKYASIRRLNSHFSLEYIKMSDIEKSRKSCIGNLPGDAGIKLLDAGF